ncbi:hypothetical protein [Haliangium sp.]|uniref:hypothetical protein n=1 Tax=Haliangium sp. TaxID=2663208 RepID=UPI003D098AF4
MAWDERSPPGRAGEGRQESRAPGTAPGKGRQGSDRAPGTAPGKVTRTSTLPTTSGAVQLRETVAERGATRVKSAWQWTNDPLMKAAHGFVSSGETDSAAGARAAPAAAAAPVSAAAPAPVQRQPDGDQAPTPTAPAHDGAGERIAALLTQPDPIAGVGNPAAAVAALSELPMGALCDALDLIEAEGLLGELRTYLDQSSGGGPRLQLAFAARALVDLAPEQVAIARLDWIADELGALPQDEQYGLYRWLIGRRSAPPLQELLEGMLAMQEAARPFARSEGDSAPRAAAGPGHQTAGPLAAAGPLGSPPAPIEPAPWAPPGDQPIPMYVGNQAHNRIAEHYERVHSGETVFTNTTPMSTILRELGMLGKSAGALTQGELALRPDITNVTLKHLFEIKPEAAAAEGLSQASMYLGLFGKAGVTLSLGPPSDPGANGQLPAPGGVFLFSSPSPGLITYRYRRGTLVPVPVPVPHEQQQEQPARAREWRWELSPLTQAEQQAIATAALSTAMIVLLMILLLPVGA